MSTPAADAPSENPPAPANRSIPIGRRRRGISAAAFGAASVVCTESNWGSGTIWSIVRCVVREKACVQSAKTIPLCRLRSRLRCGTLAERIRPRNCLFGVGCIAADSASAYIDVICRVLLISFLLATRSQYSCMDVSGTGTPVVSEQPHRALAPHSGKQSLLQTSLATIAHKNGFILSAGLPW
jgi:hypothetical protein